MRFCLLFSVLSSVSGSDLPDALTSANSQQIVAYHCTLEHNVDLILGDTFRIPTKEHAQDAGLKFGAGAYLGPNISYCIKEAANTYAERYLEAQYPNATEEFLDNITDAELEAAWKLILSKIGLPGSDSGYALGCIEATVDLTDVLIVKPFDQSIPWPFVANNHGKKHGKKCRLPGVGVNQNHTLGLPCSTYQSGNGRCFEFFNQSCSDEYTSSITPEYMKHYGYDTALLYISHKNHSNGSVFLPRERLETSRHPQGPSRRRTIPTDQGPSRSRERARDVPPTEVVVFDWDTRVKGSGVPPRKVPKEMMLQHWPKINGNSTSNSLILDSSWSRFLDLFHM